MANRCSRCGVGTFGRTCGTFPLCAPKPDTSPDVPRGLSITVIPSDDIAPDARPLPINGRLYVSRKFYDRLVREIGTQPDPTCSHGHVGVCPVCEGRKP